MDTSKDFEEDQLYWSSEGDGYIVYTAEERPVLLMKFKTLRYRHKMNLIFHMHSRTLSTLENEKNIDQIKKIKDKCETAYINQSWNVLKFISDFVRCEET
jgi:hypothetical protein